MWESGRGWKQWQWVVSRVLPVMLDFLLLALVVLLVLMLPVLVLQLRELRAELQVLGRVAQAAALQVGQLVDESRLVLLEQHLVLLHDVLLPPRLLHNALVLRRLLLLRRRLRHLWRL